MSSPNKHINPAFKRKAQVHYSKETCLKGLSDGQYDILAYLISKAESHLDKDQKFVKEIIRESEPDAKVRKLAISGSPGVGKSSFIDSFGDFLVQQGNRIAVLPVDPSSYLSKGSILGDKTRMESLSRSQDAFIKPMPSSLSLGGLAPASSIATMICERSRFDYILLETVGVGQSEVEARNIVDAFVLLLQAGGGDDLQGIKRGIMELADLLVVTKADGALKESAAETTRQIRQASTLLMGNSYGWKARVLKHSSMIGDGNDKVLGIVNEYYAYMQQDKRMESLHREQNLNMFEKQSRDLLVRHLLSNKNMASNMKSINNRLESGEIRVINALMELEDILDDY